MKVFNISGYKNLVSGDDYTLAVIAAVEDADRAGGGIVLFDKGEYDFYPENATKFECAPYGNGSGVKNITFPFIGKRNVTIDGGGSDFIFHGMITPFVCDHADNIVMKNFSIAFDRAFHTEALVIASDDEKGFFDCTINQKTFPTDIENGAFIAYSDYMRLDIGSYLVTEYDAKRKEPAYNSRYYVIKIGRPENEADYGSHFWTEILQNGVLRIFMPGKPQPKVGNIMTFLNDGRQCCSIFMSESSNIHIENVDIFDSGALSVLGQVSENISLDGVRVRLKNENEKGYDPDRVVSASADATHFCNCMGNLSMVNCVFDNMLDDGTNIHALYSRFTERLGKNTLAARDDGNWSIYFRVGDTVSIMKLSTYTEVMRAVITSVKPRDDKWDRVYTFDREIPDMVDTDWVMDNMTTVLKSTYISNVETSHNRPRGFLIATLGKVLIENCVFNNSSSGIYMQPFGPLCLESQAAEDVTIRNCRFINCGYSDNNAAIFIHPEVSEGMAPVHKNISIYDNVFESFGAPSISANNVENLQLYNNTFIKTTEYPEISFEHQVILQDCNLFFNNTI